MKGKYKTNMESGYIWKNNINSKEIYIIKKLSYIKKRFYLFFEPHIYIKNRFF